MLISLLVVGVGVQSVIRGVVNERIRDAARTTLQKQAQAVADAVDAAPERAKGNRASDAAQFLADTRVVVTWPSPGGLYFNLVRDENLDIRATARSGGVEARLARVERSAGLADWLILALFAGGVCVTAAVVWGLASALARRLQTQAAALAASAQAVAAGDLTARAEVTDDELGRIADAFNRMTHRLADADERQRRFLADVAHELRTPVTVIDGFAEALVDGAASTPEARDDAVGYIRAEASRLRELIDDLRELTLLDLRPTPEIAEVDIAELARDAVSRLAASADEASVHLNGPAGTVRALTDADHIETILANLIANAIAATPAGGRVDVFAATTASSHTLTVSDTGTGIAADDLPRIFDRLYRADSARARDRGGSGLGLAIVKGLVDALGGSVRAESTPGAGSRFTVTLPIAPPSTMREGNG